MLDLEAHFERSYCITLARRPDRWDAFLRRFADWPLVAPARFDAIDGQRVPPPKWWTQGGGAWGVYRSNLRIIEQCLMEQARSVLILEDDALPCENFQAKVRVFLEAVPADWQMLYLGGQHLFHQQHPPHVVNAEVVVPYNVNRCHAYALSAEGMAIAYRHLNNNRWMARHHIDHHYGVLHQSRGIRVYAPTEWLVGQSDGRSDICGRELPVRFWKAPKKRSAMLPTVIAVVGPYRGGTSAVAGAMHHLGIVMGHQFFVGNASGQAASPKGCFEAKRLFDICMMCYREPQFTEGVPYRRRVELLRGWVQGRRFDDAVIGAKHPKFCLMIPELLDAWPGCKFVAVERPVGESVASLTKLGWWKPAQQPESLIRRMIDTRDRALAAVPGERVLRVTFADALKDPRATLERIAAFAEVAPLPEQYDRAVAHLDPSLKHWSCDCIMEGATP